MASPDDTSSKPPEPAPSAEELLTNPVVRNALDQAWLDSLPNDPQQRHEEGGWIYFNTITREVLVRRAPRGMESQVILENPPIIPDAVIVGIFHTHPNPSTEGWDPGPSDWDRFAD